MKSVLRIRLVVGVLLLAGSSCLGFVPVQQDSVKVKKTKVVPLFESDEVLRVKIFTNMRAVLKDRGDDMTYHPAVLTYQEAKGDSVQVPLKVKTRGKFRRNAANCDLPPLLLNFAKKETDKTVFDKQDKLKLVTRCRDEDYILQEYMVYKMYNLLTDYSFKARLAQITYVDSAGKRKPETSYGFIIEDEDQLAKRHNLTVREKETRANMAITDQVAMATVAVFEYMIGNTDWSVPYQHNIRILEREKGKGLPIPVAYDFDHSGIVEARYAAPAPQLELRSTRDRLYRGLNYSEEVFAQVFDNFNRNKAKIYALYETNSALTPAYVKRTVKFLDQFYETINKPNLAKPVFMDHNKNSKGQGIQVGGLKNGS